MHLQKKASPGEKAGQVNQISDGDRSSNKGKPSRDKKQAWDGYVAAVKQASQGRAVELLTNVGGIPSTSLTGKHGPCPKGECGGKDRFRLLDRDAGAVICNECFSSGNGDWIAAIQWFQGWSFRQAIEAASQYLSVQTPTRKKKTKSVSLLDSIDPLKNHPGLEFLRMRRLEEFAEAKPPIIRAGIERLNPIPCSFPAGSPAPMHCLAFQGWQSIQDHNDEPDSLLLVRVDGKPFPATDELAERKTHLVGKSSDGWIASKSIDHTKEELVIIKVEGPSDALALLSCPDLPQSWLVVTNACGAKSTKGLDYSFANGHQCVVIHDADRPGQDGAKLHAANFLTAGAKEIRIVQLPYPVAKSHGRDLRDYFLDGHAVADFQELIRTSIPISEQDIESWQKDQKPASGKARDSLIVRLGDYLSETHDFALDRGEKLYRYTKGHYLGDGESFLKRRVKETLRKWDELDSWRSRLSAEVVEYIKTDAKQLWDEPPADTLNVQNGLLHLPSKSLRPHSSEFLSAIQLPVKYDPTATCDAITTFIKQVFPEDSTHVFYELVAWVMTPSRSIQKSVLLVGEGSNGKSRTLYLIRSFLGTNNVSSHSLHRLEDDKFALARLTGKLANISADLPERDLKSTSVFKAITGGDPLEAEYKFGNSFEIYFFAKLLFSTNYPPRSGDSSSGFYRRWHVIPFDRSFTGKNAIPADELDASLSKPEELSGLLNKAIDAWDLLNTQGDFSVSESMNEAAEDFRSTTDPVSGWIEQHTIEDSDAFVSRDVLHSTFNQFAKKEGRPSVTKKSLTQTINRVRQHVKSGQKTINGKVTWCYIGLGLLSDQPDDSHHSQHSQHNPPIKVTHAKEGDGGSSNGEKENRAKAVNPVNGVLFEDTRDWGSV